MDVERIKFERTGGFAGMRLAANFELGDLPQDQANSLTDLLDKLDFAELPERLLPDSAMPDEFTYTITVESQKWQHTVITSDMPDDDRMKELLEILNRLARSSLKKH